MEILRQEADWRIQRLWVAAWKLRKIHSTTKKTVSIKNVVNSTQCVLNMNIKKAMLSMKTSVNKTLLTWDSTREGVGHRTGEGGRRPSEGSHGRRGAAKRREGVVEVYSPRAWWGGGGLILLQLGGIWSVVSYLRCGGGGVGVWHRGIFWTILHRGTLVLFALYAAHRLACLERQNTEPSN